jgi:L-2-hydroxyglutarate oxidase LhgO
MIYDYCIIGGGIVGILLLVLALGYVESYIILYR